MLEKLYNWLSHDVGIDLGTANTLVYVRGHGVIINEPSVVAMNQKTGTIVDVGAGAEKMLGRTPAHITAIRPLVDGVISNFEATEEMLSYFVRKAIEVAPKKLLGPRVVVGVPSGITNVEKRAVRDAARNAGAREAYLVEEPMAAAIGTRLPVEEPVGNMVVDIGGGTTDIAVISLGGIVTSRNVNIAGNAFNRDIINYIRDEFKILIGEKTAEAIKLNIGSASPPPESLEMSVKGRDLVSGLPREILLTDSDVREALAESQGKIIEAVKEVLETTPPEISSDVMNRGLVLVGGGALIKGLDDRFREELNVPAHIAEDPLTCVVRGTGFILEDFDSYQDALIDGEDEIPIIQ